MKHVAHRTCVGCRSVDAQAQLLRVVAVEADGTRKAVADARRRLPGRGAWLHPRPACLEQAARGLARALRMPVPARDVSEIVASLAHAVRLANVRVATQRATSQARPDVASGPERTKA